MKLPRGTKTLLLGAPGSGKTDSLVSFLEAPEIDKLFVLGTDPGFEESLYDSVRRRKVDINKLHHAYVPPVIDGWGGLRSIGEKVNMMSYADLGGMKAGINKHEHKQYFKILDTLSNFKCERTDEEFGAVDEFPETYAFAFDGLTGLNTIAMQTHVGGKPCLHEGEWQVCMKLEENLIRAMCSNLRCFFVMTAHIVKGVNDLTGIPWITIDALGAKLGPRLPSMFSDVPVAIRSEKAFRWSTAEGNFDLKSRALPISDRLDPSFVQVVKTWTERKKLMEQGEAVASTSSS